jgi:hypothetical protein
MTFNRLKLYLLLGIACLAGYTWLYLSMTNNSPQRDMMEVCLIKHVVNIPCPSCGSTRSVISLAKGEFLQALEINPLGYVVATIMLLIPFWIIFDIMIKRKTLFEFYQKTEMFLKRPRFAIPLILLVIINWVWNITKGL